MSHRFQSFEQSLAGFSPIGDTVAPIGSAEFLARIARLQSVMRSNGLRAVYLDASSSLTYFTGIAFGASERLHGVLIGQEGAPVYVSPAFEEPKTRAMLLLDGEIATWEEHEKPGELVARLASRFSGAGDGLALDPATPFMFSEAIRSAATSLTIVGASDAIFACRRIKSAAEIAIIQAAMDASLRVHEAVWRGLQIGISTKEVLDFISAAHRALGLRPKFGAAQFGEATAYPHGVPYPQTLNDGDMVLIDMGGVLHGYCSDITRTYVFGQPTPRQRQLWELEQKAQAAGFAAARLGAACEAVDAASRGVITAAGYGPHYAVPGLPHRTGHGLGIDLHEEPYMVRGNTTALAPGMCFSIEPMLCVYGECGVRLEDICYMAEDGPRWFTLPSLSPEWPFGQPA